MNVTVKLPNGNGMEIKVLSQNISQVHQNSETWFSEIIS